jgi:hypothetical protein
MNIIVPSEFVIGQVVLKSFIKSLAVAMVNKTVIIIYIIRFIVNYNPLGRTTPYSEHFN